MSSPDKKPTPLRVQDIDLDYLVSVFASNVFTSNTTDPEKVRIFDDIQEKCVQLFSKDYMVKVIDNDRGKLSATYPNKIVALALPAQRGESNDGGNDLQKRAQELRVHMQRARVARARTRFVVPVILYEGKHICRSATLSGGIEIYARTLADYLRGPSRCRFSQFCVSLGLEDQRSQSTQDLFPESEGPVQPDALPSTSKVREEYEELPEGPDNPSPLPEDDASLHGELRKEDIELLKLLSVRRICDLMVEGKKEKFYLKVTSSEKVDRFQRYRDFTIFKLPYPGCEFFEKYVKQHYKPEGLFFDWTQHFVDVELEVPESSVTAELNIDWKNYKLWDLVELTKNYLKFLLKVIVDGDSSLLVHCISGWDRTALFISMLRLSLWADNKIHQNLSALEMAYLTAAYDWFLFSHNLPNRVEKCEEVFFFCFNMLKYISSEEFSTLNLQSATDMNPEGTETLTPSGKEPWNPDASCSGLQNVPYGTTHMSQGTLEEDITDARPSVLVVNVDESINTSHNASVESTSSSRIHSASLDLPAPAESREHSINRSGESDAETASSAGGLSDMGLEATPGLDTKSIESLPLLRMSSKHQTKEHTDIHESWQIMKETGSTDSSLSSGADGEHNTSSTSIPGTSETTENPGGAEDGTPSNKEFSLKLRRERLEEVRLLVTRAYLNMRTTAANKKTSPRCLSAIARTFSVSSAREGWRTQ